MVRQHIQDGKPHLLREFMLNVTTSTLEEMSNWVVISKSPTTTSIDLNTTTLRFLLV